MKPGMERRASGRMGAVLGASLVLLGAITSAGLAAEQPAPAKVSWEALKFLTGDWVGEGGGKPGQGTGWFSFTPDLQGKILVRKNHSEYPATADRPALTHEDLLVIYQEAPPAMKAVYFDNEGHVIRYSVEVSGDGNTATFLSEASPSAPRFRLTYAKTGADSVSIKFEMAPPGKPDAFSPYVEAAARRKSR